MQPANPRRHAWRKSRPCNKRQRQRRSSAWHRNRPSVRTTRPACAPSGRRRPVRRWKRKARPAPWPNRRPGGTRPRRHSWPTNGVRRSVWRRMPANVPMWRRWSVPIVSSGPLLPRRRPSRRRRLDRLRRRRRGVRRSRPWRRQDCAKKPSVWPVRRRPGLEPRRKPWGPPPAPRYRNRSAWRPSVRHWKPRTPPWPHWRRRRPGHRWRRRRGRWPSARWRNSDVWRRARRRPVPPPRLPCRTWRCARYAPPRPSSRRSGPRWRPSLN
mmetsp:Transcript_4737/g.7177  ORF Transcript_4737/g.7177 Transcript_4737/m.7177 type:complete len:268 (-) Transcript_4737:1149-1952(-)